MDNQQRTDEGLRELALFAGAGGGILGGTLLGWRTVCAVEIDRYAACVFAARQNDGILPPFPIWDDVCTFDGRPWHGVVDVVSGGFPCQDISAAGKGKGVRGGEKSGLWKQMARVVGEVRPQYVFVENSPLLASRGLNIVVGDLAEMGYDAQWGVIGADDAGFPHHRKRMWILGYACGARLERHAKNEQGSREREKQNRHASTSDLQFAGWKRVVQGANDSALSDSGQEQFATLSGVKYHRKKTVFAEPDVGRVANGVAARVDRLKAIGNGQVPAVAALAWRILNGRIK